MQLESLNIGKAWLSLLFWPRGEQSHLEACEQEGEVDLVTEALVTVASWARAGGEVEADLVAGLKRKEAAAFEQLIAQHGATLYRVAVHLMGQPEEGEEVLQETLLTVAEKIHTFDDRASLTTWLSGIVVGIARCTCWPRSEDCPTRWSPGSSGAALGW